VGLGRHWDEIEAVYAGVRGVDLVEGTFAYAAIPLHPGVVRYFEEKGVEVPDNLRPGTGM
jgi:TRAP-type uncharacterized transport system, periplasmic component